MTPERLYNCMITASDHRVLLHITGSFKVVTEALQSTLLKWRPDTRLAITMEMV